MNMEGAMEGARRLSRKSQRISAIKDPDVALPKHQIEFMCERQFHEEINAKLFAPSWDIDKLHRLQRRFDDSIILLCNKQNNVEPDLCNKAINVIVDDLCAALGVKR